MIKNIIFDYMDVFAKVNIPSIAKELPMNEKIKALRLLVGMKKNPIMLKAFEEYQMGKISHDDYCYITSLVYPKQADIFPKLLEYIPNHMTMNEELLKLAKKLHNDGFKLILLSNSIPESQISVENCEITEYFDGFVMSHLVGLQKPDPEIYKLACETYNLNPEETYMVDDKIENLIGAKQINLNTVHCDNFKTIAKKLENLIYSNFQPQR